MADKYVNKFQILGESILVEDEKAQTKINEINKSLADLNGSIESLISEVDSVNADNRLSEIEFRNKYGFGKRVIFFGDSYLEGYTPDGKVESYATILSRIIPFEKCIIKYGGGCGFSHISASLNKTFINLWDDIPLSDLGADITDIIFIGGWNDIDQDYDSIYNACAVLFNRMHINCPNATLHFSVNPSITPPCYKIMQSVYRYLTSQSWSYRIYDLTTVNCFTEEYFASDFIHPNTSGQQRIAYALLYSARGGVYNRTGLYQISDVSGNLINMFYSNKGVDIYFSGTCNASRATPLGHFPSWIGRSLGHSGYLSSARFAEMVTLPTTAYLISAYITFGGSANGLSIYLIQQTDSEYKNLSYSLFRHYDWIELYNS